jgi:hypothetical protein
MVPTKVCNYASLMIHNIQMHVLCSVPVYFSFRTQKEVYGQNLLLKRLDGIKFPLIEYF